MVKVKPEKDLGPPFERCSVCHTRTDTWYEPKDVPLCEGCAELVNHDDVPNKERWLQQQDSLDRFEHLDKRDSDIH